MHRWVWIKMKFRKAFDPYQHPKIEDESLSFLGDEDGAYARQMAPGEELGPSGVNKRMSIISEEKRGISIVELTKKEGITLGLIIAGGVDKGCRPKIANLRPGSIAHRSDSLAVGDYIVSVNGIRTSKLKHEEIVNLLKNAGDKVILEVEYEIPASPAEVSMCVCPKVIQVRLEKENGSFGFTLRGGSCTDPLKSRPLTITHVRPGGPADREGTIKAGDRLLALDNINLTNASHCDALSVLKQTEKEVLFTIEYDVSIMDAVRHAAGPLLVEIDKTPGTHLGISLMTSHKDGSSIVIESIKQASIAERCGALHVGDQILAIDGTRVEQMTPAEAMQLLKTCIGEQIRLEIFPLSQMYIKRVPETSVKKAILPYPSHLISSPPSISSSSAFNTLGSFRGLGSAKMRKSNRRTPKPMDACSSSVSLSSNLTSMLPCTHVCHTEATELTLQCDHRGFGFAVQGSTFTTELVSAPPIIGNLDPGGPAEKSGVIQAGDRLLAVNGQSTEDICIEEVTQIILESRPRVTLEIEFDVAESVVPSSGTFTVKLAKRGAGLGITITSPKNRRPGDPLIISDIRKGSVAHRTGTIQPGDKLLAIDTIRMDNCTLEDAAQILQASDDIVKLRIRKDDLFSDDPDPDGAVVYTVELLRHGGPLGITISGTEEPFDPILISGLTEGGLAERTGALHVGDRLLAINGQTLRGKPLSEAILLLQNSGDVVTLKISRNTTRSNHNDRRPHTDLEREDFIGKFGTPLPSIDSAVESWDSSGLEAGNISMFGIWPKSPSGNQHQNDGAEFQSKPSCSSQKMVVVHNGSQEITDGVSDSEWENRTHSSHGSHPYNESGHSILSESEDKEWAKALDDFEACSKEIRELNNGNGLCQHSADDLQFDQRDKNQTSGGSSLPSFHQPSSESCTDTTFTPIPIEIHRVTLFKDKVYEDFGFSVSDGLCERGVYVNRIRPGGPADLSEILQPFDRILQVNDTKTHDFDCCLTVPLIAAAGDQIELVVARNPYASLPELRSSSSVLPWMEDEEPVCSSPAPPLSGPCLTKTL